MKILHFITSLGSGGAEGMLYRLIKSSDRSVQHCVICLNKGGKYVDFLKRLEVDVLVVNLKFISSINGLLKIYNFSRSKKKQGFSIITSWLHHADLISWFIKIICGYDGLVWNIRNTKLQRSNFSLKNWLMLKTLSLMSYVGVNKIISCSENAGAFHKKLGYKKDYFPIIPNGYFIDSSLKLNNSIKKFEGIYKILIVARWHPMKDFENLFQALDLFKYSKINFHLTIAGHNTGSDNQELTKLIQKYSMTELCTLLGEVKNIDNIYMKSHVTVLSSAYGEAFPNVLAESMMNYTPCISTDVGDAAEILSNIGFVVPIGDFKALTDALFKFYQLLVNNNDIYLDKCLKGYDRVLNNYNIYRISELYYNVWNEIKV